MKVLHLDIETAPHQVYCWGLWDQNIAHNQIIEPSHTLCWAAKWHGTKNMMFSSVYADGHKAMVKGIHKLLEDADAVVHYNGKKFDMPILNREFILMELDPPSNYKDIDLLQVARQRFKFPSNRLDNVAKTLGVGDKLKHNGMDLWIGCLNGDAASWKTMERYNKRDVTIMEKIYVRMLPWIKTHPNYGLYTDSNRPVCKNCGSSKVVMKGMEYTSVGKYQRYKCRKCGAPQRGAVLLNKSKDRERILR